MLQIRNPSLSREGPNLKEAVYMKAWVVFLPAVEPATERRSSSAVSLPNDYVRSDGRTHGEHMVAEAERKARATAHLKKDPNNMN
jgi:hypothetical protein